MKLYAIDQHDQLLHIWRALGKNNMHVVHIDYHCDMRGLLIDREQQLAWQIPEVRNTLDEGNFLRYAFFEDIISGITWVHGMPGGRNYDVHTVKYATDWSSRFHRRTMSDETGKPIQYSELEMDQWSGIAEQTETENEIFLDIDWDTFADHSLDREGIDQRVNQFLSKPMRKTLAGIAVCFSPYHSHDTREMYDAFLAVVASKFDAVIEKVEYVKGSNVLPLRKRLIPPLVYEALQKPYHGARLRLKRMGLH